MSTAAFLGDLTGAHPGSPRLSEFAVNAQPLQPRPRPGAAVRRRPNMQQGRALEVIGHGIEYLVDSRLFITSGLDERAEQEAIQIMMRASRAVFADCTEVIPLRQQLDQWLHKRLPWSS